MARENSKTVMLLYDSQDNQLANQIRGEVQAAAKIFKLSSKLYREESEDAEDINTEIKSSDIIIVLVSSDFLRSSRYSVIRQYRENKEKYIIPVLVDGVNPSSIGNIAIHGKYISKAEFSANSLNFWIDSALTGIFPPAFGSQKVVSQPIVHEASLEQETPLEFASIIFNEDSPAIEDSLGRTPLVRILDFLLKSKWEKVKPEKTQRAWLLIVGYLLMASGFFYPVICIFFPSIDFYSLSISGICFFLGVLFILRYGANLKKRIEKIICEDKKHPLRLHLQGEWGSGKTSVLELLKKRLCINNHLNKSPVIVEYNVWQHQLDRPPWWQLPNELYRQVLNGDQHGKKNKPLGLLSRLCLRHYMLIWQFKLSLRQVSMTLPILLVALFIVILFIVIISPYFIIYLGIGMNIDKEIIKYAIAPIAGVLALFGVLLPMMRRSWLGDNDAIRKPLSFGEGPMTLLREHFYTISRLINRPILIVIDDIDRCEADQVTEMLRAMHTLFDTDQVSYIVAADKKWLQCCYEKIYEDFLEYGVKSNVDENKSKDSSLLGHLFMEKLFDLSIKIPPSNTVGYLYSLYYEENEVMQNNSQDIERQITALAKQAKESHSIEEADQHLRKLRKMVTDDYFMGIALQISNNPSHSDELKKRTIKKLNNVGQNPRKIKHIVNLISIRWPLAQAYQFGLTVEHIIQWTIFQIRFPLLAIYVSNKTDQEIEYLLYLEKNIDNQHDKEFKELKKCDNIISLFKENQFIEELLPKLKHF